MLQALQALKYDEDPEISIEHFYKEANKMFKDHYLKDKSNRFYIKRILEKYTECIILGPSDPELKAKILSNRALINCNLKNYGRVIEDCTEAIKVFPTFIKPYFRKCEALQAQDRNTESIETAELGLQQEANKELSAQMLKCQNRLKFLQKKDQEKDERKQLLNERKFQLLTEKSIVLGKKMTLTLPSIHSKIINFDNDGKMTTPVVFLYPEFSQWDYVQEATEDKILQNIFGEIFEAGLPWDTNGHYRYPEDLEAYIQLNSVDPVIPIKDLNWSTEPGLLKQSWEDSLLECLQNNGYVMPVIPEITIVSKVSSYYIERFVKDIC